MSKLFRVCTFSKLFRVCCRTWGKRDIKGVGSESQLVASSMKAKMEYNVREGTTRELPIGGRWRDQMPGLHRRRLARRLSAEFAAEKSYDQTVPAIPDETLEHEKEGCENGSTPKRKIFSQLQPVAIEGGHHKKRQENVMHWFFPECKKVKAGIKQDLKKVRRRLESEKDTYTHYRAFAWSNTQVMTDLQVTIGQLELDVDEFPDMVLKMMCTDMVAVFHHGGALANLRKIGPRGIYEGLISNYVNRWKSILFRRAVFEFVLEEEEQARWPGLILGGNNDRVWLVSRRDELFGEQTTEETAKFIVEMLFPAKYIEPMVESEATNAARALAACLL